jgi:hypothetical protein
MNFPPTSGRGRIYWESENETSSEVRSRLQILIIS